uniref:Uncharacterized protein n=1 Tax=Arundo donax TaxID=35708 RepID=A0A0A9C8T0_ARUDO
MSPNIIEASHKMTTDFLKVIQPPNHLYCRLSGLPNEP